MKHIAIYIILLLGTIESFSQTYKFTTTIGELKKHEYADIDSALKDSFKVIALNLTWDYHWCRDKKHFSDIPPDIKKLKNLKYLTIDFNPLTTLPAEIGELTNLEELSIRRNNLIELPKEIGKLKNLKYLNLYGNKLTTLPSEIGNLKNLEILILSSNPLIQLPEEISNMENLKYLDLHSINTDALEQLTITYSAVLPELKEQSDSIKNQKNISNNLSWSDVFTKLSQLPNLETLDIHNCYIKELPPEIGKLTTLKKLYIGQNQFESFPEELSSLTNLKELYFSQWKDDYSSWSNKEKKRTEELLPKCDILLLNYFGPTCSRDKKYKAVIKANRKKKNAP